LLVHARPSGVCHRSPSGHSRQTEEPQRFAECPLCFHQRLNLCVATKRREVP
jgi:hypothetical protein